MTRRLAILFVTVALLAAQAAAQVRLADESDRAAFAAWFIFLADAQFYRPTADVTDCAGLVRHAFREALRAHTPEWTRQANLPVTVAFPDVRRPPRPGPDGWPLFRVDSDRYAEFADARTIVRYNARPLGRDIGAARPGDLLFFHQADEAGADHLMVFLGPSLFDRASDDWVVYHTGADAEGPGEVRKVRLADLLRHPVPRWRPLAVNPGFEGLFRLAIL